MKKENITLAVEKAKFYLRDWQVLCRECAYDKEKPARCYRSFYSMTITPAGAGYALATTCWNNMFYPENKVIVREDIKSAWNSPQFKFQRRLILKGDWSFCKGACCIIEPFFHYENKLLENPDVKSAITDKKEVLPYGPKVIVVSPSHACNNECYCCYYVFMKNRREQYRLKDSLIKEIEETLIPSAENVIISGGEPFFAKESIGLINRIVSNHPDKKIAVNTNGTLLHEYGLDKIIRNNIFLTITVYGMEAKTYEAVTKRNSRDIVFGNIQGLIERGYEKMQVIFLLSERSVKDSDKFCEFIARNDSLKGIVRNNWYEGAKYWELMRKLEEKYTGISSRLKFQYQNVSLPRAICRRLYNPIHTLRYLLRK